MSKPLAAAVHPSEPHAATPRAPGVAAAPRELRRFWLLLAAGFAGLALLVMWWRWGGTVEDSLAYFNTARYLRGELPFDQLRAPFPYRLLMPALAAALPGELHNSFARLNWLSVAAAATMLAMAVAQLGLDRKRVIGAGLLLILSVPTFWYAPYLLTDPGSVCARAAFVLAVLTGQPWLAAGAGLVGSAVREENILLLVWLVATRRIALPAGLAVLAAAGAWMLTVRWVIIAGLPHYTWIPSVGTLLAALRDVRSLASLASAAGLVLPLAVLGWRHAPPALRPLKSLLLLMALPPLYAALSVRVEGRAIWGLYPMLIPFAMYARWRHEPAEGPAATSAVVGAGAAPAQLPAASPAKPLRTVPSPLTVLPALLRAMRPRQWLKNLLVFVPMLAGHALTMPVLLQSLAAFAAFCLCASSAYLLNDALDVHDDRQHPTKRHRPIAAGLLPVPHALAASAVLAPLALILAAWTGPLLLLVVLVYFIATVGYTAWLKRLMMVDIVTLALLYSVRILGGSAATAIEPSFWLLSFSFFLFLSLALLKRCSELFNLEQDGQQQTRGRGYHTGDRIPVSVMGVASAFLSVLIFMLYFHSDAVLKLYPQPGVLLGVVPLLVFWLGRLWLLGYRGNVNEDPLLYVSRDGVSLGVIGACLALVAAASR
jgi:4-hydroxybenzoate polyprenyltransferase